MGQCVSVDDSNDWTEYKYIPYDWLGETEKDKDKLQENTSVHGKDTDKSHFNDKHPSVDIKVCAINDVNNYTTVVYKADFYNKEDVGHISFALIMGQCTSARTAGAGNSIEEEPYAPVKRRNSEPNGRYRPREHNQKYRSRYEPYDWDIYVDTESDVKRDRARSFSSLRWDIYATPEQVRRTPEKSEPEETKTKPKSVEKESLDPYYSKPDKRIPGDAEIGDKNKPTVKPTDDKSTNNETIVKDLYSESDESDTDIDNDRLSVKEVKPDSVPVRVLEDRNKPDGQPVYIHTNGNVPKHEPVRKQTHEQPVNKPVYKDTNKRRPDNEPTREQVNENKPVHEPLYIDTHEKALENDPVPEQTTRNKPDTEPIFKYTNGKGLDKEPVRNQLNTKKRYSEPVIVYPRGSRPDKKQSEPVNEPTKRNMSPSDNKITAANKLEETPTRKPFTERVEDEFPMRRISEKQLTRNPDEETPRKAFAERNNFNDDDTDERLRRKDAPPDYSDVVYQKPPVVISDGRLSPRALDKRPVYTNASEKEKPGVEPVKSEHRASIHTPYRTNELKDSPPKKSPESVRTDKGKEEAEIVTMYQPRPHNGLVKPNNKPSDSKEKESSEPVIVTAVISPSKDNIDFLGTRPEKNAVKETVLIPNKFPQLFVGKRHAWRGLLLFGPAGSGKASLATAVAKEIGHSYCTLRTFMSLNSYKGNAIAAMFKKARESTPHVIIIDHLDGLSAAELRELHKEMASSTDEQFEGLLVVGISDSPWLLDKSVVELFEKRIYITLPSAASRAELFRENLQGSEHAMSEEDFVELGAWSEGYSCADIITVVNETLMRSLRKIQEATYFKKINAKDPVTNRQTDLYTPCSPGEVGAIEMDWTRIPEKKLQEPVIRLCDVLVALRTQKPSLDPGDINKHKQFAKKFTQHL